MKTEEINEKLRKIKGAHFKNYSYLSCLVLNSAKPDFKLMPRHSMFTKMIQFITHQIISREY